MASLRRVMLAATTVMVVAAIALVGTLAYVLNTNEAVSYTDPRERFLYGSMGTEVVGAPALIFEVLPDLCSDMLPEPGGWESLGFMYEPGRSRPIGTSERTLVVPRVGVNCAACHVGSVRETPESEPQFVLGMPSARLDFQGYAQFVFGCISDPRFTPDNVLAAIQERHEMPWWKRVFYRYGVLPKALEGVREQRDNAAWHDRRPSFGPGRYDAFTTARQLVGLNPAADDTVGVADYPAIWNQAARQNLPAQWDGSNPSLAERNRIAMLFAGADVATLDVDELLWMDEWLLALPVPPYPFAIDAALTDRGEAVFQSTCASCHAPSGEFMGQVTPLSAIGTDPERLNVVTDDLVERANTLGTDRWQIRSFRRTDGYVNPLLDGIWARGPYLHNGSVPTLADLLTAPEDRPKVFYRGYDVYDPVNVGFVSTGPGAETHFRFDTTVRGNGNGGHRFGIDLLPADKQALIEYLKTR